MNEINHVLDLIRTNIEHFPECNLKNILDHAIIILEQVKYSLEINFTREEIIQFITGKCSTNCKLFDDNFNRAFKLLGSIKLFFQYKNYSYLNNIPYLVQALQLLHSFFNIFQLWTTYQNVVKADNLKDELKKFILDNNFKQKIDDLMKEIEDLYGKLLKCFESLEEESQNKQANLELFHKLKNKLIKIDKLE
ncbi:unnamed protein product [Brachionus calyciflorus]|uniref:Uncharacterized protein n=1 Tax=Brachionus calyciflorus TaxID=104777 RepID=A0A813TNG7_9BILA|nr:unnamed protein product [Brachionus calyciflorus]